MTLPIIVYGPVLTLTAVLRFRPRNILTFDVCRWERTRLGMSNDGARAAFVEAFFEVAGPKIKKVSVAIEVICSRQLLGPPLRSVVPAAGPLDAPTFPND